MTIQDATVKVTRTGNGSATSFSFAPIVMQKAADILVVKKNTSTGVETTLTEGTGTSNYSVTLTASDYPSTGSIVFPASGAERLSSSESLTIKRDPAITQTAQLENQGGYFPDVVEQALDRGVMISMSQQEDIDRSLKGPITDTVSVEIPSQTARANQFLTFDGSGVPTVSAGITGVAVSAFMATVLDDTTAAAARTTLGAAATSDLGGWATKSDACVVKTANYTVLAADDGKLIRGNAAADITFSLPTVVGNDGMILHFLNSNATGNVILDPSGAQTINGAATYTLEDQWSGISLWSDGSAWRGFSHILPTVQQAEAEAGTATFPRAWTAERVGQAIAALGASISDQQVFDASGTWSKPASGTFAMIEVWGAGGGGGHYNAAAGGGGGGGGGAYATATVLLSALSATEAVTIGAGGIGALTGSTNGTIGGTSDFGALVYAYGGGGGSGTGNGGGGGGGGALSAGQTSLGTSGYPGGTPGVTLTAVGLGDEANSNGGGGGGGGNAAPSTGGRAVYGGGGGGGGISSARAFVGGASYMGGGGGGGGSQSASSSSTGGASFGAGNGGAGGIGLAAGSDGVAPAGGGGGAQNVGAAKAGNGAAGRVRVTIW